jgi:hypothetical protein
LSEKPPVTIEEDVRNVYSDLKRVAKLVGLSVDKLIPVLMQRELILMNAKLREIDEHLFSIEKLLKEKK